MASRRSFIKTGVTAFGSMTAKSLGLWPLFAQSQSPDYRALVCVFLTGGNDSNNLIVPMDSERYNAYLAARGNLALTGSALTGLVQTKTNPQPYAFHAGLAEVAQLFSSNQAAVVANVGTLVQPASRAQLQNQSVPLPANLFSHPHQVAEWQTCVSTGPAKTGWGGRVADAVASLNNSTSPAFLSTAANPLMGTGAQTRPVVLTPGQSLSFQGYGPALDAQARLASLRGLLTVDTGSVLMQAANSTLALSVANAQILGNALAKAPALRTSFPSTCLGAQLAQISQIIQVRASLGMSRQIFFCSLPGFDTHTGQLSTQAALFQQLSQALWSFQLALVELGVQNCVTTFTASEFSRTFQPSLGEGTDHGWGGHQLVVGGAVRGGDVYGTFPNFALGGPDDADVRGRWIPTTAVDQYAATLASWLGVPDAALPAVFPNLSAFSPNKLSFLG